jgi:prolyl-tRNA synthetase
MRLTQLFAPTLKESPADAQVASHKLLVRAGFIRQLSAGIYCYLPLFRRVQLNIEQIIREEMNRIGAQEFYQPALHPKEIWEESGRWEVMGQNMFRLKDRKGAELCLGMTAEEVFTLLARNEVRSYKELPQTWYQIQNKFRDEARPKSGLLRVRQFTMKDAYSFHADQAGLDHEYEQERHAYERIFTRAGLRFVQVDAHTGAMGGSGSTEFMVRTDAGEDDIIVCEKCGYAANVEKAQSKGQLAAAKQGAEKSAPSKFPTPNVRTIEDLAKAPYSRSAENQLKTLVYIVDGKLVLAVVRGDDELNEAKFESASKAGLFRPATSDEIFKALGAHPGSLGAVGVKELPVLIDSTLAGLKGMVTGANQDDVHLEGVDVDRDLKSLPNAKLVDLRKVHKGESCVKCGGTLDAYKALEVGHIFKLGTKYSESMKAMVLDKEGKQVPIIMGCYGIGVERIAAAAVELSHDDDGIIWPMAIAPFKATVLALQGNDAQVVEASKKLYEQLQAAGIDCLLDDRDERAGVKFKDADLIGIPLRFAIGKKTLAEGQVELKLRSGKDVLKVPIDGAVAKARELVDAALKGTGA